MPETTKPLYVQYTSNKDRFNCCKCKIILNEDNFPIDRKGELFNQIDEFGIDQFGGIARVKYLLGDCDGLGINCSGNCYYVRELDTGVEFLYTNADGQICGEDPPFSENDPILLSVEEALQNIKAEYNFLNEEKRKLSDKIEVIINDINSNTKDTDAYFDRLKNLEEFKNEVIAIQTEVDNIEIQMAAFTMEKWVKDNLIKDLNSDAFYDVIEKFDYYNRYIRLALKRFAQ